MELAVVLVPRAMYILGGRPACPHILFRRSPNQRVSDRGSKQETKSRMHLSTKYQSLFQVSWSVWLAGGGPIFWFSNGVDSNAFGFKAPLRLRLVMITLVN